MSPVQQYMNRVKREISAMFDDNDHDGDTVATAFCARVGYLTDHIVSSCSSGYDAGDMVIRTFTSGYGGIVQFVVSILL